MKNFNPKYCDKSNPLVDKNNKCVWCGEEISCDWWHNITRHNMPITWDANQSFENEKAKKRLKEHLHFHIGWLGEQIMDRLEELNNH